MWPELLYLGFAYVPANNYAREGSSSGDILAQVNRFTEETEAEDARSEPRRSIGQHHDEGERDSLNGSGTGQSLSPDSVR
jgi:hypothetical protein